MRVGIPISSIEMIVRGNTESIHRTKFNHWQGNKSTIINQTMFCRNKSSSHRSKGNNSSSQQPKQSNFRGNTEFTAGSNNGTVQINERTHSLSINSNQTSRRLHGNKSLQCSSTLVQGFREFKPFRENLGITMHRYELPIGNNSFDKNSP